MKVLAKGTEMDSRNEFCLRIDSNIERGQPVRIIVDGEAIQAYEGESVAAAMLAAGRRIFRHTHPEGQPRGVFCGMGVCFECLVTVDGERVRACTTPVRNELHVTTGTE